MKTAVWLTAATLLVFPFEALTQVDASVIDDSERAAPTLEERLDELEKTNRELARENATFKREIEDLKAQDEEIIAEQEAAAYEDDDNAQDSSMEIHGFFDLTFYKAFFSEESIYGNYMPSTSTFVISNINLYFIGQMTETLGMLVETHLSFLPHGHENGFESIGVIGGEEQTDSESEYDRVDTWTRDPVTTTFYNPGSITIERAHLTYTPLDWLNVIAGRYLTPYGIWNIDHGSPVILVARWPYMQLREMVPMAQTGLQVYGRFFPSDVISIDYAVTLSNGRGPIEELLDLDENKGVGLRLRLAYYGDNLNITLGGYGYYGKYTEVKKSSVAVLDTDLTIDLSAEEPIRARTTVTEAYYEYIVSADLMVEFFGVKLQGEYVFRYVDYETHGIRTPGMSFLSGANALETIYNANNTGNGVYGLLSWELPLAEWINPLRITPFFMYEHNVSDDTMKPMNFDVILGGINLKPSPFVALKLEYSLGIPQHKVMYRDNFHSITAQMAVSF